MANHHPNTSGLKRDAGPGRPKGSRDRVPRTFKASIRKVFEDLAATDPELIRTAVLRGLKGRPREAFPFVQLFAHYIDGKPKEQFEVSGEDGGPVAYRFIVQKDEPPRE